MKRNAGKRMLLASFVAGSLILGATAHAQEHAGEIAGKIDRIFSWTTAVAPGCSVAVSQKGRLVVSRAYGLAVPITPGTKGGKVFYSNPVVGDVRFARADSKDCGST